jgi:hypothetical protein
VNSYAYEWIRLAEQNEVSIRNRRDANVFIYMGQHGEFYQHIQSKGMHLYTSGNKYILSTRELIKCHENEKQDIRIKSCDSDVHKIIGDAIKAGKVPGPAWMLGYILRCLARAS